MIGNSHGSDPADGRSRSENGLRETDLDAPSPVRNEGLIFAHILDGHGGGRSVGWPEIRNWRPEQGVLWLHLDRTAPIAATWLQSESEIDPIVVDALLESGSRPRAVIIGDDLMVYLRGVNLNPGSDPEDMVGLGLWLSRGRIVSLRHRRVMAANDLHDALAKGQGPRDAGGFLVRLAERLLDRMGPVIVDLDDQVDELQETILTGTTAELRGRLADLRREAIALRRYLAPQREVIARLSTETTTWIDARQRAGMREVADRITRMVEDLDAARERAAVTQDELNSRISDQMNRTMYALTIIAAILLPPSFLTGLFGVNLAGMPGLQSPFAFGGLVLLIIGIAAFEIFLLRRLRWI
jgi:zinc transporter